MNRTAKITYGIVALAVVGLLAGAGAGIAAVATAIPNRPAPSLTAGVHERVPSPTIVPNTLIPLGGGISVGASVLPDGCTTYAMIEISGTHEAGQPLVATGKLRGEPVDKGPRQGAKGTVNRDGMGRIVSYTVAPGDAMLIIGQRLCMDDVYLAAYNNVGYSPWEHELQAGETLIVRPDPTVQYVAHPVPQ